MLASAQMEQHKQELVTQGFTKVAGFYTAAELAPLKARITRIIAMVHAQHGQGGFPDGDFDSAAVQAAYLAMVRHDRALGSRVYDAVKQIPEFVRMTASARHCELAGLLRGSDFMGINRGGDGIRIDYPHEKKFMAPWHQDYPSQLGSRDGLVFWCPLVDITPELGPLEVCVGSHKAGLLPIYYEDAQQTGNAYGMRIADEATHVNAYRRQPLPCKAGDLLVIDFLTLHRSGANIADRARWSMQLRYFNFNDAEGARLGWPGGLSQGKRPEMVHPDLLTGARV